MKQLLKKVYIFSRLFLTKFTNIPPRKMSRMPKYILNDYLSKNLIMLDCGAHDGKDTIELIDHFGGEIHAFEALPYVFEQLKKNTESRANIKCYPIALSHKSGKLPFYVSSGGSIGSSSLLPPKDHLIDHPDTKFEEVINVDALTLDEWADSNNVKKIDFMWLDMQGAEKMMLEASPNILKTVKVIYSEVSVKESYQDVAQYGELKDWMFKQGFRVEVESIPEGWDCGDALFVRFR